MFNLYNILALTEVKGYAMLQFSYMMLNIFGEVGPGLMVANQLFAGKLHSGVGGCQAEVRAAGHREDGERQAGAASDVQGLQEV